MNRLCYTYYRLLVGALCFVDLIICDRRMVEMFIRMGCSGKYGAGAGEGGVDGKDDSVVGWW